MAGRALCLDEREEIRAGIEAGRSAANTARRLRRHPTTVSREIRRKRRSREVPSGEGTATLRPLPPSAQALQGNAAWRWQERLQQVFGPHGSASYRERGPLD